MCTEASDSGMEEGRMSSGGVSDGVGIAHGGTEVSLGAGIAMERPGPEMGH